MKKTIFAFCFAIMFSMALGSCGNCAGAATDADSTTVDSAVVDSVVADTVALDSIEVAK